jgi:glycosyltransferase involved in cell wall biosynthesis
MSSQEGKIPATLTVLTKNNAKTLEKTLESSKDFDDIVVCDGGSTDATLDIAKRYGANIITQDPKFLEDGKIFDFGGVRNQTYMAARHNWIFWLDSDEVAGPELIQTIREVIRERGENGEGAFWVNRKYVLSGTIIDCASTYPNRQMRFFAKNSTEQFIKRVHERIKLKPGVKAEILNKGFMYLPTEDDIPEIRRKWDYQIAVAVEQAGELTLWQFIHACFDNAKISTLWFLRMIRNYLFCPGTKMPFRFEMERHRFHIKLLQAMWKVTRLR